uniref:SIAH-type domain-containing protein n=3 Tax=Aegilops tauschii subsp. strangulata TaxID=200361 RepID=A0A453QK92_AEGTS
RRCTRIVIVCSNQELSPHEVFSTVFTHHIFIVYPFGFQYCCVHKLSRALFSALTSTLQVSAPTMENGGEPSNKKSRLQEEPMAAVKQERLEMKESQGGAGALATVEEAMQVPWVAAEVNPLFYLCFACQLPLRPPVHQCEGGHRVCGRCHGDRCTACDPPAAYSPFPFMDDALGAVQLPCCYRADGCGRKLMYHEAADHALQCAFAPCHCPGHGCSMWASPPALLDHIAAAHSWPVTEVGYGSPFRIAVPTPWRGGGTHLLVERNDRRLFLVTLSEFGEATAVTVVCVREGTAAAAPRFRSTVWAEVASNTEENLFRRLSTVPSSSGGGNLSGGGPPVCLLVPPDFGSENEDLFLGVRIDKL